MGVRMSVVHRHGGWLFGWDGYGKRIKTRVDAALASRIGQSLCYVVQVRLDLPETAHVQPWSGFIVPV